jgi:hypothetical protein
MVEIDRLGYRFQGCGCVEGAVWAVLIVVDLVLVQDAPQMGLVPYEGTVALGDRMIIPQEDLSSCSRSVTARQAV